MNLCTNAVQAMPAGGTLDVHLERTYLTQPATVLQGQLSSGPYVRLTVHDPGTGIEPEVLDQMFDPFFTTKPVGEGTGLGLSLVHGIVGDVGGAIDVTSTPGQGTTFVVWMPITGSAPVPVAQAPGELPRGRGEVVMIVDDEPVLVGLAEETLAQLGYEPVGFESGSVALQAFTTDPQRFDLVLTDEMMPELTGTALALRIRQLRPDIPVVLMSGRADRAVVALARSAGIQQVLHKPLRMQDVADCFSRVLGRPEITSATGMK
jgi:CheY-like chemotaxis protein